MYIRVWIRIKGTSIHQEETYLALIVKLAMQGEGGFGLMAEEGVVQFLVVNVDLSHFRPSLETKVTPYA